MSRTKLLVNNLLVSKFQWKSNREHKGMHIRNSNFRHMKRSWKFRINLCTKSFTYTKKFYVLKITIVNLSEIYFLKKAKKTCKPNNCNLNCDWKMKTGIIINFIFQGFINRSNHQHMFWKMLSIKCRKNSCEGVPFWKK